MSDKPNYFRLGVFVLLGFALFLGALLAFGGGQMFRPKAFVETYVNGSVQGVDIGSAVKFRGVQIGRVSKIDFTFNMYDHNQVDQSRNYVVLVMEIDREIAPGIFDTDSRKALEQNIIDGLRVRIEPQGITGLNYLDFGYVDPKRYPALAVTWNPEHFYIPYAPGEITSFLDSINNIMREVEKFNLDDFSESALSLLHNMNRAVVEAQIGKISNQLDTLLTDLQSTIDQADVGGLSADARKLMSGLEQSNAKLEKILQNLEPATRLNQAQIREIVTNTSIITENLLQLSSELRSRPSLLLWGSPPKPTPTPRR